MQKELWWMLLLVFFFASSSFVRSFPFSSLFFPSHALFSLTAISIQNHTDKEEMKLTQAKCMSECGELMMILLLVLLLSLLVLLIYFRFHSLRIYFSGVCVSVYPLSLHLIFCICLFLFCVSFFFSYRVCFRFRLFGYFLSW